MNEPTPTHSSSSQSGGRVLVLAPDENLAEGIRAGLLEAAPGAEVQVARSLPEAQQIVLNLRPDLFVLDIDASYNLGQEFLYDLRTSNPNARAIVLTGVHLAAHRESAAGLGAIHFLEKPFPHDDFVALSGALLQAAGEKDEGEKFQGTLSDLHLADIIQLKCMGGVTSVLEFTGPRGEKARVFFDHGQVRHAIAPGKEGVEAFNEIVNWRGGMISEVSGAAESPRTIDLDWQILLMEAVRQIDETRGEADAAASAPVDAAARRKILVIDDSVMLLNFVQEILAEANYDVTAAATAQEGLSASTTNPPHLILLDYVLPDMKGDEVLSRLQENRKTARVPVIYMSGFGTDRPSDPKQNKNVIGSLHKPFTSELLLQTVATLMPEENAADSEIDDFEEPASGFAPSDAAPVEENFAAQGWAPVSQPEAMFRVETTPAEESFIDPAPMPGPSAMTSPAAEEIFEMETPEPELASSDEMQTQTAETAAGGGGDAWWEAPLASTTPQSWSDAPSSEEERFAPASEGADLAQDFSDQYPTDAGAAFFCGDTSFFSFSWALHTISAQRLTGTLRCFWNHEPVELLTRNGQVLLASTRDPDLYCPEAPITLVNLDEARVASAREEQRQTGRPLFVTLAQEELILREPALQLVQHYGQKLFAQLWTAPKVRILFEKHDDVPAYAQEFPSEEDVDHWALSTLRFIQASELGDKAGYDEASVPAYTRDGFQRVQRLRLTVAEAQFASQFNGVRSIAQIAKNLRLDLKFARLTLFRFLALEIVECWPPSTVDAKQEKRGVFGRMFGG